jgi:hypothetical protein
MALKPASCCARALAVLGAEVLQAAADSFVKLLLID